MTEQIELYLNYIAAEGASANTQAAYERDLRQFFRWYKRHGNRPVFEINPVDLESYLKYLKNRKKSNATISRSATALRQFFSYEKKRGVIFSDPTEGLTAPKVIRKAPKPADMISVDRLLRSYNANDAKEMRDKSMLLMILSTGITIQELLTLTLDRVDPVKKTIRAGADERICSLDRRSSLALNRYLSTSRMQLIKQDTDNGILFVSCKGEKMSRQGFWKNLKKAAEKAGVREEFSPEMLRHRFALNAVRAGEGAESLQKKLGHATRSSALEYLQLSGRMK